MNTTKSLNKDVSIGIIQIILINKVIKFVNFLNLVHIWLLKPKKETISKVTMYLQNSFIKEFIDKLRIMSQGKAVRLT